MLKQIVVASVALTLSACATSPYVAGPDYPVRATASAQSNAEVAMPIDPQTLAAAVDVIQRNNAALEKAGGCGSVGRCGTIMVQNSVKSAIAGVGVAALSRQVMIETLDKALAQVPKAHYIMIHNAAYRLMVAGKYMVVASGVIGAVGSVMIVMSALAPTPALAGELDDGILSSQANFDRLLSQDSAQVVALAQSHPKIGHALVFMADGILSMSARR